MDGTRDEKRASLVETALAVLSRQGIKKTTLEDIANAAGIATTSIYYYFPNKQQLLRSVMETVINKTLKEIEAAAAALSAPEDKLIVTWKVLLSEVRNTGFLLNRQGDPKRAVLAAIDDQIRDFEKRYKAVIHTIITEGVERGVFQVENENIEVAVMLLSSGVVGMIKNMVLEDEYSMLDGKIEQIGKALMNGMRRR